MILVHIILLMLFGYLAVCTAYNAVFAVAGTFLRRPSYTSVKNKRRFVIVIPAYKEDGIIINTVKDALAHNYPTDRFDIVVIADSLNLDTIIQLQRLPIRVIRVFFEKSTKAKALKLALQQLPDD